MDLQEAPKQELQLVSWEELVLLLDWSSSGSISRERTGKKRLPLLLLQKMKSSLEANHLQ
jgi:hypothetical protein